jgi:dephospho-CoA kinase
MTIVAFGGRIASGKSSVSKEVAARLAAPWVSFGDAVRAEASKRGLPPDRAVLQELGDELIAAGWNPFVDAVIGQAVWDGTGMLVVDGVRHAEAVVALERRLEPNPVVLVFLETADKQRVRRLAERGVGRDDAAAADSHPNEAEVDYVRERADTIVVNNGRIPDAVAATLEALTGLGVASDPGHPA